VSDAAGEIVRRVRGGDRAAFGALVQMYEARLFGLALMMVREPAGAEEVTQDAFVRAFTYLERYDEHRPFYPWLATIAVRLSQNWLRAHRTVVTREAVPIEHAEPRNGAPDALAALIEQEGSRALWQAIAALPSGERTAVMLYYRDGMVVRDVARALGVTTGTIKTLLFRARRHLRERLTMIAGIARKETPP
jgi:RNA polymerase sigma-70 factor, ECF subfamily